MYPGSGLFLISLPVDDNTDFFFDDRAGYQKQDTLLRLLGAASIFSFSITRGIILVPAILFPFLPESPHVWMRSSSLQEN